jgi:hypothetical protein
MLRVSHLQSCIISPSDTPARRKSRAAIRRNRAGSARRRLPSLTEWTSPNLLEFLAVRTRESCVASGRLRGQHPLSRGYVPRGALCDSPSSRQPCFRSAPTRCKQLSPHPPATSRPTIPRRSGSRARPQGSGSTTLTSTGTQSSACKTGVRSPCPGSNMTVVSARCIDWIPTALMAAGTGLVVYAVASANHPSRCRPRRGAVPIRRRQRVLRLSLTTPAPEGGLVCRLESDMWDGEPHWFARAAGATLGATTVGRHVRAQPSCGPPLRCERPGVGRRYAGTRAGRCWTALDQDCPRLARWPA